MKHQVRSLCIAIASAGAVSAFATVPPCPTDVAGPGDCGFSDGGVTVDDLVCFLSRFFANDATVADNCGPGGFPPGDGAVTVDDLVNFLRLFFGAGCA
ncbi:MAG: GC-type dockerin domain-anchored protein [Phycisphaerales bacterium]